MLFKLSFFQSRALLSRRYFTGGNHFVLDRSNKMYELLETISRTKITTNIVNKDYDRNLNVTHGFYLIRPDTTEYSLLNEQCRKYLFESNYSFPIRLTRLVVKNNGPETLFRSFITYDQKNLLIARNNGSYNYVLINNPHSSNYPVDMNLKMCVIPPSTRVTLFAKIPPAQTLFFFNFLFDINQ